MASEENAPVGTARRDALPPNSELNDYQVERVLGSGGFGIVYLARHVELDRHVAIKEYLPTECAVREGLAVHAKGDEYSAAFEEGLSRFRDEARRLVDLDDHPAIVSCRDFFRANGTAYLVMEYAEGEPLSEVLRTREAEGRPFSQSDLLNVIIPLLEGLTQVHAAGVIHRDIKPGNIMIREMDGHPVLIDFGAAKQGVAELSKSMAPFTEGYAAVEQVGDGKLGPWTDIYAVGAVMWRMVAGGSRPWEPPTPPKVESRASAQLSGEGDPLPAASELGDGRFTTGVLTAIDKCLRLQVAERIQDCDELSRILSDETATVVGKPLRVDDPPQPGSNPSQNKRGSKALVAAMGTLLFLSAGALLIDVLAPPKITPVQDQTLSRSQIAVRDAAEQGDATAQYNLGEMYERGNGVPQDYHEAAVWFRKAADQGHALAQERIGRMYLDGRGVPQDDGEAWAWFRKAADQGDLILQLALGLRYANGRDVPQDLEEAMKWFRMAADQGDDQAQYNLGLAYEYGRGVPKDSGQAAAWLRKAADQGNAKAQTFLGFLYSMGKGVPQDSGEAVVWFRKAAEQGDASAQTFLGNMYSVGAGVPQDDVQAFAWWHLAAEQGDEDARKFRDNVGGRMSPDQILEAQGLILDLMPQ